MRNGTSRFCSERLVKFETVGARAKCVPCRVHARYSLRSGCYTFVLREAWTFFLWAPLVPLRLSGEIGTTSHDAISESAAQRPALPVAVNHNTYFARASSGQNCSRHPDLMLCMFIFHMSTSLEEWLFTDAGGALLPTPLPTRPVRMVRIHVVMKLEGFRFVPGKFTPTNNNMLVSKPHNLPDFISLPGGLNVLRDAIPFVRCYFSPRKLGVMTIYYDCLIYPEWPTYVYCFLEWKLKP